MSYNNRGGQTSQAGFFIIILGMAMMLSVFLIPQSVMWSKYGDSALTVHVWETEELGNTKENYASGAWINIEPTRDGGNIVDVWGGTPPTSTDTYGLMTFYMDVGVFKWVVKYDGKEVSGYVQTTKDKVTHLYVYVDTASANYKPSEAEYTGDPVDTSPIEVREGEKTVYVETKPVSGVKVVVISPTTGKVYADYEETPFQFKTDDTDFIQVIWTEDVEGYVTPDTWSGQITDDLRITGHYRLEEEVTDENPPEDEAIDYEETPSETTDTEPPKELVREAYWGQKITQIKTDIRYQVLIAMGALTTLLGVILMISPIIKR